MRPFRSLLVVLVPLLPLTTAHAKGDASGSLGSGGRARGDISRDAGETDRITATLAAGALVTIRLSAGFDASLAVARPDGTPVDVGASTGSKVTVTDRPVETGGDWTFAVSSHDGSQGAYTLSVKQRWPRAVAVSGTGEQVVDVPVPAGARLSGTVRAAAGTSGRLRFVRIDGPGGESLLAQPIEASGAVARLPRTTIPTAGLCHLTVGATETDAAWAGTLRIAAPAVRPTQLRLANGLDAVSFARAGVGTVFRRRCSGCHPWATGYRGVRAMAGAAYPRIRAGVMPPDGRLPADEIALIRAWIATGKAR